MLIENHNKKYFMDLFDQEKHSSIYFDLKDQKIKYKLNHFKKSLNSSLKRTIIKALKKKTLVRTQIIDNDKYNQGSLTTIKVYFIAAKTDRTSKAKISLSETAQALVKRMPIDQLMIGFLKEVRMGVAYTQKYLNSYRWLAGGSYVHFRASSNLYTRRVHYG